MQSRFAKLFVATTIVACTATIVVGWRETANANQEVDDLRSKISSRTNDIKSLETEIATIENDLKKIGSQKSTLQSVLQEIELTRKKLAADIALTEKKIEQVTLNLERLGAEIGKKGDHIETDRIALAETARKIRELDNFSLLELLLSNESLGQITDRGATLAQLAGEVDRNVRSLKEARRILEIDKTEVAREKATLLALRRNLSAQKTIEDQNQREKSDLLKKTAGQETRYKKMLEEKRRLQEAFETELFAYEAQLKIAIDPSTLPLPGTKALLWPLRDVLVTQNFGDTDFSRSQLGLVYNGKGHNGIDMRASVGTPIYAAAGGTVIGTGDTDNTCRGASYGKWMLIEHNNGLSTLYAHMSFIGKNAGDHVVSGDQIGYSGSTGYATGPHLHFSVFASKGVAVGHLKSKNSRCGVYTLPIASFNSYLDPLLFL